MRHDIADWSGQFVLSPDPVDLPGWSTRRFAGFHLVAHPDLPVVPVSVGGEEAGALVGWPVSQDGALVDRLDLPGGADAVAAAYELGGRWLLVTPVAVYVDACASQPAVYSAGQRVVASSPGLIDAEEDPELVGAFDVVARDGWYPFGLTPRFGVRRLLPNHALDLSTFRVRRHHAGPAPGSVPVEEAARVVLGAVEAVARAFSEVGLASGLTAGRDSRFLLAAFRPHIEAVRFVTGRTRGAHNDMDVQVAQALARRHGFRHEVVDRTPAPEREIRSSLRRMGGTRAGARYSFTSPFPRSGARCSGAAGEVARAYYWNGVSDRSAPLTPREACERVHAPALPAVIEAAGVWLKGLPDGDRFRALDHLYLEQRVGCWASPGNLGDPPDVVTLYPLARRDAIDAMMGLGADAKLSGALADEAIRQAWPGLGTLPFNEPLGLLAVREKMRAALGRTRFVLGGVKRQLLRQE